MKPRFIFGLFFLALLLSLEVMAQGCAMCKATVESQDKALGGPHAIGLGLNSGILYLMAVPYLLLFLLLRKRIFSFFKEFASAQG